MPSNKNLDRHPALLNSWRNMCLVSFVPLENSVVITSSRDEDKERQKPTLTYNFIRTEKQLNFPQDVKGGTWIGYDNFKNLLVILNGARTKHQRVLPYRKSRGLIVLELLDASDISNAWKKINLIKIEPFTLIHYSKEGNLWEYIWDGHKKITTQYDTNTGYCWLSSTLYTPEEWAQMKIKFQNALPDLKNPESIRNFHLNNRYETKPTGVIYPPVKTVSNTTVHIKKEEILFDYLNLR